MDEKQSERRADYTDIKENLARLSTAVESLEKMMNLKLDNLEEKIKTRLSGLEKKMEDQAEYVKRTETEIAKMAVYEKQITGLNTSLEGLTERVQKLETAPVKSKASLVEDFVKTFKQTCFTLFASGLVGLLVWLVIKYMGG